MVMVPLGVELQPGMRVTLFPKAQWEKTQNNEKLEKSDEARLKGLKLDYTLCHSAGCTAEAEATPELLSSLTSSGGLMVFTVGNSGTVASFSVPLVGFAQALAGKPAPPSDRKALLQPHATRCDPYFDPITSGYSCPKWRRQGMALPRAIGTSTER